MRRREFVKTVAGGIAAASVAGSGETAPQMPKKNGKIIGIQVGSVSFVDEGVEKVLDIFQQRAPGSFQRIISRSGISERSPRPRRRSASLT